MRGEFKELNFQTIWTSTASGLYAINNLLNINWSDGIKAERSIAPVLGKQNIRVRRKGKRTAN